MTEWSGLWTTGSAGDGANTYTRLNWATMLRVMAACQGSEGIAPEYLNALACAAGGANQVTVGTGGALVDGKPYENSTPVTVAIPSAVGAGNTRIDRLVLRADWTAQTVRIMRVAGTDAASPSAPAISQTSGATYDVTLCQVLVDTSGVCTVTDERSLAQVGTAGLEDGALAASAAGLAKMADGFLSADAAGRAKMEDGFVDDTKAGERVPKLTRRQGGDATDWTSPGTTGYTPDHVLEQVGAVNVTITDTNFAGITSVVFPVAFSAPPLVWVSILSGLYVLEGQMAYAWSPSTTGFDAIVRSTASAGLRTVKVAWRAVGPVAG